VNITLGLGDINVHVSIDKRFVDILMHVEKTGNLIVNIDKQQEKEINKWVEYTVQAPKEYLMHPVNLTKDQIEENKKRVMNCDSLRNRRIETYYDQTLANQYEEANEYLKAARGNFSEVYKFVSKDKKPLRLKLLKELVDKDYLDLKADILEEHIVWSAPFQNKEKEEIFCNYILSPRIHYENLSAYRKYISEFFTEEQKDSFINNPRHIWNYINTNFSDVKEKDYKLLIISPVGALKLKLVNEVSRKVLFVAICRTLGIPARMNSVDHSPEYYEDNMFVSVIAKKKIIINKSFLQLLSKKENKWIYNQTWSIGRLEDNGYKTLDFEKKQFKDNQLLLSLESGEYRIITANRIPTGNILAEEYIFNLVEGEVKTVILQRKEAMENLLSADIEIPDIQLLDNMANKVSIKTIAGDLKNIFVWIEEGKEPTEHILNEMIQLKELINQLKVQIIFIINDKSALNNKTLYHTLEVIPAIQIYYDDFTDNVSQIARRMQVDSTKLPLVLVTNTKQNATFASSGYNVGVVEQIIRAMR